jgi:hypothetical protein
VLGIRYDADRGVIAGRLRPRAPSATRWAGNCRLPLPASIMTWRRRHRDDPHQGAPGRVSRNQTGMVRLEWAVRRRRTPGSGR